MKTAAILCPGPSLNEWPSGAFDRFTCRLGINRTAFFLPCDFWVVMDAAGFKNMGCKPVVPDGREPPGNPILVSHTQFASQWRRQHDGLPCPHYRPSDFDARLIGWDADVFGPLDCSSTLFALAFAVLDLTCAHVEIFGADYAGETYFDGSPVLGHRKRWPNEQRNLEALMDALSSQDHIRNISRRWPHSKTETEPATAKCHFCGRLGHDNEQTGKAKIWFAMGMEADVCMPCAMKIVHRAVREEKA